MSVDDVESLLKSVDVHKAMGSDQLPSLVLKQSATVLAPTLRKILSASLDRGLVPDAFKLSFVSPLFKGGDASLATNYRPVSLLPVVSRLLETLVKTRLMSFLSANNLLPPTQFAYRQQHSTEDALTLAVDRWTRAKSNFMTTGVVLVDMSKAFDRVRHERLLSTLFSMGVCGTALEWFSSYLTGRRQRVKVGSQLSPGITCTRGVPQGSVLGPILFLLYTSSLSSILPSEIAHQEFADDIMLDYSHKDPNVIGSILSTGVSKLADWLDDIGLLLNEKKTQVMFILRRGATPSQSLQVKCRGFPLSIVNTVKYLGLHVDSDLSWSSHLAHLGAKARKATAQLWRYGNALTIRAKKTWYVSMIQSSLCYASTAFFPSLPASNLSRLVRMSKAGVRAICAVHLPTATAPLLRRLELRPLTTILLEKVLLFVFRCVRGLCSRLFEDFFRTTGSTVHSISPRTRGHDSALLRIPFVPGPAGRSQLRFQGSVAWNNLPAEIRQLKTKSSFVAAIRSRHDCDPPVISSAVLHSQCNPLP